MAETTIPVLKAWNRIFDLLECIHSNPYNRDAFEKAVLDLYPGKSPKSVFRGMAIPTLRNLGFIVGYGDVIRISANGALVHAAYKESRAEGLRALRAVLLEIDDKIGILPYLEGKPIIPVQTLIDEWLPRIAIDGLRVSKPEARRQAARERILDWLHFLNFAELLYIGEDSVMVDADCLARTRSDISVDANKRALFGEEFFVAYNRIVLEQGGIKTVEIENLRKELGVGVYRRSRLLVTERQFDILLTELPKTSEQYTITLGRSIGADEKLFRFQGQYYQTVFIRTYDEVRHEDAVVP